MFRQSGNEMGVGELVLKRDLLRFRPLPVDKLEEIETDRDAVNPDQIAHVLDVIDVAIERRFFLVRTDQDRVDPDDAAPRANGFDLFVADIALDIEIFSRVRVRDDDGPRRYLDDVVEPGRADMRQVDDNSQPLAFANDIASERRKPIARRTGGGK